MELTSSSKLNHGKIAGRVPVRISLTLVRVVIDLEIHSSHLVTGDCLYLDLSGPGRLKRGSLDHVTQKQPAGSSLSTAL